MSNFLTATGIVQTFGYGREEAMTQEKLIREKIKNQVLEETQRKVRCVFFLARTDHDTIIYGISGNSKGIFATAEVDALGNIHLVY